MIVLETQQRDAARETVDKVNYGALLLDFSYVFDIYRSVGQVLHLIYALIGWGISWRRRQNETVPLWINLCQPIRRPLSFKKPWMISAAVGRSAPPSSARIFSDT